MIRAIFYFDDGSVSIHSENTKETLTKFKPGYYLARLDESKRLAIQTLKFKEVLKPFPNQNVSEIIDSVNKFVDTKSKDICNKMGYVYKLNFLLHGTQGSGKTALITYLCNGLIENHDCIVFRIDSLSNLEATWSLAEEIRLIQDNPLVFIMDEFDDYCSKSSESYVKTLLDGARSINNSMVFAATNYLEKIPDTLRDRPSRFRVMCEIKPISSKEVIRSIIEEQHGKLEEPFLTKDEIDFIVDNLSETTVDEVKSALLDKVMNMNLGLPQSKKIGFKTENHSRIEAKPNFENLLKVFNVKTGTIEDYVD